MTKINKATNLTERLRYHVTGAIERGEAEPIIETASAPETRRLVTDVEYVDGLNREIERLRKVRDMQDAQYVSVKAQRDELLSALKFVQRETDKGRDFKTVCQSVVYQAIAKAEGSK